METNGNCELVVDEMLMRVTEAKREYALWLVKDGNTVAYMSVMSFHKETGDMLSLCDIETRDGYRQQGYASRLMFMASEHFNLPLHTTGSYTPEGFAAFKGKLPMAKGYTEDSAPSYGSMNFVADWDNRWVEL